MRNIFNVACRFSPRETVPKPLRNSMFTKKTAVWPSKKLFLLAVISDVLLRVFQQQKQWMKKGEINSNLYTFSLNYISD